MMPSSLPHCVCSCAYRKLYIPHNTNHTLHATHSRQHIANTLKVLTCHLSRLRSGKCGVDTRCPPCNKAGWPRLCNANWYRIHPRLKKPSSVASGCARHCLVLGVLGSVALGGGGGVPLGMRGSLAGGSGRVVMGVFTGGWSVGWCEGRCSCVRRGEHWRLKRS